MLLCDLNCDMGEGVGLDEALMPWITSANIACGFHAGNGTIMRRTMDLALQYKVHIGAHPSFYDRDNFGRREMKLSNEKIYAIVIEQLIKADMIAREKNTSLYHVKPHGALYNMAARDQKIAPAIALAVKDFNEDLVLYGLSGSCMIHEASAIGLKTASEVFADRTYQDDGSLTPRSHPNALIEDEGVALRQVLQMVHEGTVTAVSGKRIPIVADTICIHSDGRQAVAFARSIHQALQQTNIATKAI